MRLAVARPEVVQCETVHSTCARPAGEEAPVTEAVAEFVAAAHIHEPETPYEADRRGEGLDFIHFMTFPDTDAEGRHRRASYTARFVEILYPRPAALLPPHATSDRLPGQKPLTTLLVATEGRLNLLFFSFPWEPAAAARKEAFPIGPRSRTRQANTAPRAHRA